MRKILSVSVCLFCLFQGRKVIESEVTSGIFGIKRKTRLELDAERGFALVKLGRIELRRAGYVSSS